MLIKFLFGNGEPEIPNFVHIALVEDVGWLDISVHVACIVNIEVSIDDLSDNFHRLVVGDVLALFQQVPQISLAQFRHNVGVVLGGVHIVEMEDARRE